MLFPRRLTLALLCAPAFGIAMSHAATSQSVPPLSVEETVALATVHAGDAESSRGTIDAATQMAVAAGQLPDPVLKLGINNVPVNGPDQFSVSRDFMTMRSISVMQEFTRADKRRAKAARFEAEADAAEAQRAVALANVQRNAVGAWLDRWYAEQTGALLGHHGHPLELALQAATAAYRSGRGTRADVLAMELEIQKLQDRLDENRAAVTASAVALERWIGRPPPARSPSRRAWTFPRRSSGWRAVSWIPCLRSPPRSVR